MNSSSQTIMVPSQSIQPLLSICIPTYNRAPYLNCLLHDLEAHIDELRLPYEVLIGDNCSQDDTSVVVAQHAQKLNLVYVRHTQNLGAYENLNQLYLAARGRYTIYLGDDDLLLLDAVHDLIQVMESNPSIGVTFAPWYLYDRLENRDWMQFYTLESDTVVAQGDHASLFTLLVNRHLFPEIYIARTDLRKSINLPVCPSAFIFFTQAAAMVDRTSVLFAQRPFYRSVTRYFENESRAQSGHEEVKIGWDRYRGGLEYILSRFAHTLSAQDLAMCRSGIDRFAAIRMGVGLRLRTADNKDWVENYYLAARLLSTGYRDLLPAPYDFYRVNAALEHLLSLKPFLPQATQFAYMADDPPLSLMNAQGFSSAPFRVLQDATESIPDKTVLVTVKRDLPSTLGVTITREMDLLALFP